MVESSTHSMVTQAREIITKDTQRTRSPVTVPNGQSTAGGTQKKPRSKYKHVAAPHKEARPSCLSHETKESPSFLGFRNLMVLVISEFSLIAIHTDRG